MTKTKRIARALKEHQCANCRGKIPKGTTYYREINTVKEEGMFYSWETKFCPKCKYYYDKHKARLQSFKPKCHHPLTDTHYGYIPGEAVKEPNYDYCLVCGKII